MTIAAAPRSVSDGDLEMSTPLWMLLGFATWTMALLLGTLDRIARQTIEASTPLGRWGSPEDVAAAAVFLASPDASFLTGQTIFVGGGVVM